MIDPRTAPPRTDLPYLRRRVRQGDAARGTPPPPSPVAAFVGANGSPRPNRRTEPSSLDLDTPAPPPPVPTPASTPPSSATSLDLDAPAPRSLSVGPTSTPPLVESSTSLDLDDRGGRVAARVPEPAPPPDRPTYRPDRVVGRARTILTVHRPSVTLNRLQSGVGTLTFEAVCPPSVGDLRLGCCYELASGWSSTVQRVDGNREGPRHAPRPVLVAVHEQYERIEIDLRQCRDLRRALLYLYSGTRTALRFAGAFTATTFGGASIEVPLEIGTVTPALAAMSLYNVDGEFVLRAEMEPITGSIRDIGRAYGFERITWVDDSTPTE